MAALSEMIEMLKPEYRQILKEKRSVLDIWGVSILKEHTGKKLLHKMMLANEMLGK